MDESIDEIPFYAKARILVVDDEINRKVIEGFCSKAGYELVPASDGPTALKLLDTQNFDLVLLDLMLPGMSVYEVFQRIRQSKKHSLLPVIMVTARDTSSDMVRGFVTSANDYITKPFTRSEFLIRIENQLALKQMIETGQKVAIDLKEEIKSTGSLYQQSLALKQLTLQMLSWERVIKEDMEVARAFQNFLMEHPPHIPGLNFHIFYRPLITLSSDVYDIFEIVPGIIRIFLADVT